MNKKYILLLTALILLLILYGWTKIRGATMGVSQAFEHVGGTDIIELTIHYDDREFPHPFDDIGVTTVFTHDGAAFNIDGFYYDKNTWKVRFNPPKKGKWEWILTFKTPRKSLSASGSFMSKTDTSNSFLHVSETNPFRLTQDNKTLFNGIGIQNMIKDVNGDGNPLDDWFIGDNTPVSLDTFATTYGPGRGGFNLYRWSIDNASFRLVDSFSYHSAYLIKEGQYGDALVKTLKNTGYHVWLTLFGFSIPLGDMNNPNEVRALSGYVRYVVARYGAYVSIWEIANEAHAPDALVDFVAKEIKTADFENRPISMSWEHPALASINIIAPHSYTSPPVAFADVNMSDLILKYTEFNKPILFGEMGNSIKNWSPDSALIMRVRSWVAFFKGAILVFWNQSDTKNYYNPAMNNANQYIGPEERKYMENLRRFTEGVDINMLPFIPVSGNSDVRAYGLRSDTELLGYFYHAENPKVATQVNVPVKITGAATVGWYNPATGATLRQEHYVQGSYIITSPDFTSDIALKIRFTNE